MDRLRDAQVEDCIIRLSHLERENSELRAVIAQKNLGERKNSGSNSDFKNRRRDLLDSQNADQINFLKTSGLKFEDGQNYLRDIKFNHEGQLQDFNEHLDIFTPEETNYIKILPSAGTKSKTIAKQTRMALENNPTCKDLFSDEQKLAIANKKANSELQEKIALIQHLENILKEKAKISEELGSKIIHLQDKNLSLQEIISGQEKEVYATNESHSRIEKDLHDLSHRFEDSQIQVKILEKEIKQLKFQMEDTEYSYSMKMQDMTDEIQMYHSTIHELNSLLDKHSQPDTRANDQILELNQEILVLKDQIKEFFAAEEIWEEEKSALQKTISTLKEEVITLSKRVQQERKIRTSMELEVKSSKDSTEEAKMMYSLSEDNYDKVHRELEFVSNQLEE